ncbi:hypothetical protein A4E12_004712 [Salmonella enterica subsp. enterica]|nr:hypothetical protein [Salmonella enterica subsp. enterica]EJD3984384.1 hypothetical protein [Salmonella enterica]
MNLEVPTCGIAVSGTDLDITIYFDNHSMSTTSASAPTTFILTGCRGKRINISMNANNYDEETGEAGFAPNASESISTKNLLYRVYLSASNNNTLNGYIPTDPFPMNSPTPVVSVLPDSDKYALTATTRVIFTQWSWNGGNADWYTSYTYNFTYA